MWVTKYKAENQNDEVFCLEHAPLDTEERRGREVIALQDVDRIFGRDRVTNEVLERVGEERRVLDIIKGRKRNWLKTVCGKHNIM